ncbi:hypothetical protein CEUSTIGMA_g726.t1 [Chlamydomonas eustigma]|uniref:Uncharacterized protein n=1 Tax=Chlamydomonas eustigma TaxID=1157962 RepID=A0A250WRH7_9CHLO|nr:hypothetical protein CEUSTIGMA_g726.t1 [Chlamydomonas eustigma]|eukprot:GAX73272.1 hypothetical protein CEUSTIGMA_g726.t1 [Chlamydomonas eustigma]
MLVSRCQQQTQRVHVGRTTVYVAPTRAHGQLRNRRQNNRRSDMFFCFLSVLTLMLIFGLMLSSVKPKKLRSRNTRTFKESYLMPRTGHFSANLTRFNSSYQSSRSWGMLMEAWQQHLDAPHSNDANDSLHGHPVQPKLTAQAKPLSALEAFAMADIFFHTLLPSESCSSAESSCRLPFGNSSAQYISELKGQHAQHLVLLLKRIWQAHTTSLEGLLAHADVQRHLPTASPLHCSTPAGVEALLQVLAASEMLQNVSCAAKGVATIAATPHPPPSPPNDPRTFDKFRSDKLRAIELLRWKVPEVGLPHVMVRRVVLAVLHILSEHGKLPGHHGLACRSVVEKVSPGIIRAFAGALNCSRAARPAIELLHISKAGGTSMCQLAKDSGLVNPYADMDLNCLVQRFKDDPKWARMEYTASSHASRWLPAVVCPKWAAENEMTCDTRASFLVAYGINFFSNEVMLRGGTKVPGSAQPCRQFETAVVLRDPVDRTRSHIIELRKVYARFTKFQSLLKKDNPDLNDWKDLAPALLNNYQTRSLLGRQFMHCRDFGSLGEEELMAAALTLMTLDHVLVLGEDNLNDVVMRAGMGWAAGLASKRWRWSYRHDLEDELHFPKGILDLLNEWNSLDNMLIVWGGTMLRLDVEFHSSVALLSGHIKQDPNSCEAVVKTTSEVPSQGTESPQRPLKRGSLPNGIKNLKNVVENVEDALRLVGLDQSNLESAMQAAEKKLKVPEVRAGSLVAAYGKGGYVNLADVSLASWDLALPLGVGLPLGIHEIPLMQSVIKPCNATFNSATTSQGDISENSALLWAPAFRLPLYYKTPQISPRLHFPPPKKSRVVSRHPSLASVRSKVSAGRPTSAAVSSSRGVTVHWTPRRQSVQHSSKKQQLINNATRSAVAVKSLETVEVQRPSRASINHTEAVGAVAVGAVAAAANTAHLQVASSVDSRAVVSAAVSSITQGDAVSGVKSTSKAASLDNIAKSPVRSLNSQLGREAEDGVASATSEHLKAEEEDEDETKEGYLAAAAAAASGHHGGTVHKFTVN